MPLCGNVPERANVKIIVMLLRNRVIFLVAAAALVLAAGDSDSVQKKIAVIESDTLKPGSRVELTPGELDAYARQEAPAGVRNTHIQLGQGGQATGTALIDFGKLRRAQGNPPGWLMSKLLDGEHPVSVTARIRSSAGHATVDLERVQISGIVADGKTLDFLIQNVLLPLYPDAIVGRPFELGHRIDRLEVRPSAVSIVIGN